MLIQSMRGKKPIKCAYCDYSCAQKSSMKRHVDTVHEGQKPFKCESCDYSCAIPIYMKRHIARIHGGKKPI